MLFGTRSPVLLYDLTEMRKLHDTKSSFEYDKSRKVANVLRIDCLGSHLPLKQWYNFCNGILMNGYNPAVVCMKFDQCIYQYGH